MFILFAVFPPINSYQLMVWFGSYCFVGSTQRELCCVAWNHDNNKFALQTSPIRCTQSYRSGVVVRIASCLQENKQELMLDGSPKSTHKRSHTQRNWMFYKTVTWEMGKRGTKTSKYRHLFCSFSLCNFELREYANHFSMWKRICSYCSWHSFRFGGFVVITNMQTPISQIVAQFLGFQWRRCFGRSEKRNLFCRLFRVYDVFFFLYYFRVGI